MMTNPLSFTVTLTVSEGSDVITTFLGTPAMVNGTLYSTS